MTPTSHATDETESVERLSRLARTFVSVADTLVDDYDVVEVLDMLTEACLEVLPVTEAGLLLKDAQGSLRLVASSSEATRVLELLQLQHDTGPCVEAVREGNSVVVGDLEQATDRWPGFAAQALGEGFRSVYAIPLRLRQETVGGLNLFGDVPDSIDEEGMLIARALADVATIGILQQRSILRSSLLAESLQLALNTRVVIEQAKGVLAERGRVGMDEAFNRLRSYSRSHSVKLGEVAHSIVYPPHIADAVLEAGPRKGPSV